MFLFGGRRDRLRTGLFSGQQLSAKSWGSISMDGQGDKAVFTFADKHGQQKTSATVQVCERHQLRSFAAFNDVSCEESTEELVTTWHTKKTSHAIIKFTTQNELAFVFSTTDDLNDCYSKWEGYGAWQLAYFKELEFVNLLERLHLSVAQLRTIPGMDAGKIKLLVTYQNGFIRLLKNGVTLEQIGLLEPSVLEKYTSSGFQLESALKFVTMQQILGLNHTPRAIPVTDDASSQQTFHYLGSRGYSSCGAFSSESRDNHLIVTHNDSKTTLTAVFGTVTEERKNALNASDFSAHTPEKLVHDWYRINKAAASSSDDVSSVIYCPDSGFIITETSQTGFPEQSFRETYGFMLASMPYYQEKSFVDFLVKNGTTLDELRALPGMTPVKTLALFDNRYPLVSLLQTGIRFADLARVDEDRLVYILSHYSDAKSALNFVNVFELFGLGETVSSYSPGYFQSASSSGAASSVPEPEDESCLLL